MRIFFNSLIFQIVFNAYILWSVRGIFSKHNILRKIIALLIGIELALYLAGFFFSQSLPQNTIQRIVWITTTWLVFIVYFSALLMGYDIIRILYVYIKKSSAGEIELKSGKIRKMYLLASLILVAAVMLYGNYRFKNPVVSQLHLSVDKKAPGIKSLKVVMISDVHVGLLIGKEMLHKYVDLIMEQKPDMVVLVGDIIDYDLASVEKQHLEDEFRRIKAPYGTFMSTGNHEYIKINGEKKDEKINWLNKVAGLTVLRDSVVKVSDSFYLVGREDDRKEQRKHLSNLLSDIDKTLPIIVLNHEPNNLNEEVDNRADIAL